MQIEIKIDIPDLATEDSTDVVELFSEVARSSSRGNHRIIIDRKLTEWILQNYDLGISRGQIEMLGQKYAMMGSSSKDSKMQKTPLLIVHYGSMDISKIGNNRWIIGHRTLLDGDYLEKTVLIVEGPTDVEFYKLLLESEAVRINFGTINYVCEQAGGQTVHFNFTEHVTTNKRTVLCICDSDKIVPDGIAGKTFNRVRAVANTLNYIGTITCTPGKSVENFIPLNLVKVVMPKFDKKSVYELEEIISKQGNVERGQCVWLHYNLRRAPTKDFLLKNCATDEQKSWVMKNFGEFFENSSNKKLPVFGKTLMTDFLENEEAKSEYISGFLGSQYWNLHFSEWVHDKLWYICGEEKYRS